MGQKIERDHQRFRKLVRGKVKSNLSKYISRGEMIGKKGKDLVSIPLPQIDIPQFRYGKKGSGGVGQGQGQPGQPLGARQGRAEGGAGDQPGGHILEVELTMEEMAADPRRGVGPAAHRAARQEEHRHHPRQVHRHPPDRPRVAAPLQAHLQAGAEAPDRLQAPTTPPSRSSSRSARTSSIAVWKEVQQPQSVAVIIYMMDVSGSMTDEQKEIVRIEAFWIDTWIKAHYKGVETVYIIHDAAAQEVDEHTFYHTRESGGTKISSAYTLADKIITARYPPDQWNIYAFHFSDGDNWGDDIPHCIEILTREAAAASSTCSATARWKAPTAAASSTNTSTRWSANARTWSCSRIPDRDAILGSIKEFLGTGR